jgi:hypothetical protein
MRLENNLIIDLTGSETNTCFPSVKDIDWDYILRTARANRLDGFIFDRLARCNRFDALPEQIREGFEGGYHRTVVNTRLALQTAAELARAFSARGVDLLVLRGPALGLTIYPRPYLRPFGDLDLLVLKDDLPAAGELLRENGFEPMAGLLPDRYFEKHHLHLSFTHRERGLVAELHWALDHPYTLFTVNYPALFEGKELASFEGQTIPVLSPEDRLLTLSLHFLKHCPFLSELIREDDSRSLLLRGRWMIWLLDIYRALIYSRREPDWRAIREKAREWNLEYVLSACLDAVEAVYRYRAPLQGDLRTRRENGGLIRTEVYARQLSLLRKNDRPTRFTRLLFGLRSDTIFRPVRLLDAGKYIFPGSAYLKKQYGEQRGRSVFTAARHALRGAARLFDNLVGYLYYRL